MLDDIYRLQKFIATVGCGGVCSALLWNGKMSDDIYGMIIIGTVGAFIGGEVLQKVKELNKDIKINADQTLS